MISINELINERIIMELSKFVSVLIGGFFTLAAVTMNHRKLQKKEIESAKARLRRQIEWIARYIYLKGHPVVDSPIQVGVLIYDQDWYKHLALANLSEEEEFYIVWLFNKALQIEVQAKANAGMVDAKKFRDMIDNCYHCYEYGEDGEMQDTGMDIKQTIIEKLSPEKTWKDWRKEILGV